MERDDTLSALSAQLTELQTIVKWALGFGFVATLLAVQGDDPITLLGLKLTRIQAFVVISILYTAACAAVLSHFHRTASLLGSLAPRDVRGGINRLAAHPWLLNPFSFGGTLLKRSHGALGIFVLVSVFWFCLSGLYALLPQSALRAPLYRLESGPLQEWETWIGFLVACLYFIPLGVGVCIGYLVLTCILETVAQAAARIPDIQADFRTRLGRHQSDLKSAADAGIGVGGLIFLAVLGSSKFGLLTGPAPAP